MVLNKKQKIWSKKWKWHVKHFFDGDNTSFLKLRRNFFCFFFNHKSNFVPKYTLTVVLGKPWFMSLAFGYNLIRKILRKQIVRKPTIFLVFGKMLAIQFSYTKKKSKDIDLSCKFLSGIA